MTNLKGKKYIFFSKPKKKENIYSELSVEIKGRTSLKRSLHPPPLMNYKGVDMFHTQTHTHTQTDIATYRLIGQVSKNPVENLNLPLS